MGNVRNNDLGFGEKGLEGLLPLVLGSEDLDGGLDKFAAVSKGQG